MAYNYYPNYAAYGSYMPQITNPAPAQNQPQSGTNSLIWVQGEGAAKSYLVAPGCTVALFDNESQTIYIKSADASGMPSMRILDYTFRDGAPQVAHISSSADFATKEDVSLLKDEIDALRAKFGEMEGKKK